MFLAIDSSIGTAVALVGADGTTLAEVQSSDRRGHAEHIGWLIAEVFELSTRTPSDVTFVVMGVGPGPFTGLRVGMAGAGAFALSRSLPLLPVVSHDALGYFSPTDVVVVTDARRGEVAYSLYSDTYPERRGVGPALARVEELEGALGDAAGHSRIFAESIPVASLALVAADYLEKGKTFPSSAPQYLRAPDVSMPR